MVSLKMQIEHAHKHRREIAKRLKEQDDLIKELESYRWECNHEFSAPLKGYEHEGGHCTKCGINEVDWECNKAHQATKVIL